MPIDMLYMSDKLWKRELRRSLRFAQTSRAGRRKDTNGLQACHVSIYATTVWMRPQHPDVLACLDPAVTHLGGKPTARFLGAIKSVLVGSTRTADRQHAAKFWDSPECPACGCSEEDPLHLFTDCPRYHVIRNSLPFVHDGLPTVTRCMGIALEPQWMSDRRQALWAMSGAVPQAPVEWLHLPSNALVYTDGSCAGQSCPDVACAGSGGWVAEHQASFSLPVPGLDQSSDRAELFALLVAATWLHEAAAQWDMPGTATVKLDCQWVVDAARVLCLRPSMRVSWAHEDLWWPIREILLAGRLRLIVDYVPGHATASDVAHGRLTAADREGNHHADCLASAGARGHAHFACVADFGPHVADTANRQVVLAQIIDARHALLRKLGKAVPSEDAAASSTSTSHCSDAAAQLQPEPEAPSTVLQMQHRWPRYPWAPPASAVAFALGAAPASLRATGKVWAFGLAMARALRWYFDGLAWQDDHPCSFFELMVDFLASTHTTLYHSSRPQDKHASVKDLLSMFTAAVRALPSITGRQPVHPASLCKSSHLTVFGLQKGANCLTHRPRFRCPEQIFGVFLHCLVAIHPHGQWDWDLPELSNDPLWIDPDAGGPQLTVGNLARVQAGLQPTHKTAATDLARDARLSQHNLEGGGHHAKMVVPEAPAMSAEAFKNWWRLSVELRCERCGVARPLWDTIPFLAAPCAGLDALGQ